MTTISDLELGERLGRIETKLEHLSTIVAGPFLDHEKRLRTLEEFKTKAVGISIALGIVWAIINVALNVAMKAM